MFNNFVRPFRGGVCAEVWVVLGVVHREAGGCQRVEVSGWGQEKGEGRVEGILERHRYSEPGTKQGGVVGDVGIMKKKFRALNKEQSKWNKNSY